MISPERGAFRRQGQVLRELKLFSPASLRHVESIRVTDLAGQTRLEAWEARQVSRPVRDAAPVDGAF